MAAARLALRLLAKRRLIGRSWEKLRADDIADPPPEVTGRHSCTVSTAADARGVWLDRDRSSNGTVVFVHGGSFVSGPFPSHWRYLSRLCEASGLAGLLVDYRLAPEHPFPAGLDDLCALIAAERERGRLARGRWVLAGDSAGGGLALAAAYRLLEEAHERPAAMLLISPSLDLTLKDPETKRMDRTDPLLSQAFLERIASAYAGEHDLRDPLISPLFGNPAGLPPILVHAAGTEMILPAIRKWRTMCGRAGVPVAYEEQRGAFHGFPLALDWLPEARRALRWHAEYVAAACERVGRA